ncbi:MAG: transketolase [Treponema sp.]|nr:transketolase [Treponema sp.]
MNHIDELKKKAAKLRLNVIKAVGVDYPGHIGGAFSAADIVAALYFHKMSHSSKDRYKAERDRFLLSKGHVAILQYAALAEAGYFPEEELTGTKQIFSRLQGHPDLVKTGEIGIEAGTGSLGQGLSIGVGMALGLRLDKINAKVYVLLGDGELAEGQNWEAAMSAARFGLDNLVAIVDRNEKQAQGSIADRFDQGLLKEKWEAFGFKVIETAGNDMEKVVNALDEADNSGGRPVAILAHTVKGYGLDFAEAHPSGYHNFPLTREQYESAIKKFEVLS